MKKLRETGRQPLLDDLTADQLTRLCRYLSLKPIPKSSGRVNKPDKFVSVQLYCASAVTSINGEELEVHIHMYPHTHHHLHPPHLISPPSPHPKGPDDLTIGTKSKQPTTIFEESRILRQNSIRCVCDGVCVCDRQPKTIIETSKILRQNTHFPRPTQCVHYRTHKFSRQ